MLLLIIAELLVFYGSVAEGNY